MKSKWSWFRVNLPDKTFCDAIVSKKWNGYGQAIEQVQSQKQLQKARRTKESVYLCRRPMTLKNTQKQLQKQHFG